MAPRGPRSRSALCIVVAVACGATLSPARGQGPPPPAGPDTNLVELTDARTATSKTFAAGPGRRVTRVYSEPIHHCADDGSWKPLAMRFERTAEGGYEAAGLNGFNTELPADLSTSPVAAGTGDDLVRLELKGGRGSPSVDGATATYEDALPGVTASYRAAPGALKEDLTLHGPTSPRRFEFALRLRPGLTPRLVDNRVEVTDPDGRVVVHLPAPFMFERDEPADGTDDVTYALRADGGEWLLTVTAADAWLDVPDRQWPVVVDPTIQKPALSADCSIMKENFRWRSCAGPGLFVGYLADNATYRSLLRFDIAALPAGHSVDTAAVVLHQTAHVYDSRNGVAVQALEQTWDKAAVTWRQATATTQWQTPGGHYDGYEINAVDGERLRTNGPKEWDVTDIVKRWVGGSPSPNHGFMVKAVESAPHGGVTFASSGDTDPAKRPYLEIAHDVVTAAGNTVDSPTAGDVTGRRLPLQGRMTTKTITGVEWEYRTPTQRHWQTIPAAAVRTARNAAVTSWPVAVTHGAQTTTLTPDLTWDLTVTPGVVDGPVKVRARYTGPGGGVTAKVADVRLHRKDPAAAASAPIGPGSVNLLTGNLSVDRTDVGIESFKSDLTLSRTYNSRGENRRTAEMFGPGWESSVGADGPAMQFRGIYNFTEWERGEVCYDPEDPEEPLSYDQPVQPDDPQWFDQPEAIADEYECYEDFQEVSYAVLEGVDGSRMKYSVYDGGFVPDDESNTLALSRIDASHLVITDEQGNKTTFASAVAGAPEYRPIRYEEPAATNKTQLVYGTLTENGRPKFRLERAFAPSANSSCDPSTESDPGCRRLRFEYSQTGPPRLVAVHFRSFDPAASTMAEKKVMAYRYDSTGRLAKAFDPRLPNAPGSAEPPGETYTYDSTGRLVSVASGPDAPWRMEYGPIASDPDPGRLLRVKRSNLDGTDNTTSVVTTCR